jgi:uncharacterized protein YyaL (SSP411 family)
MAGRESQGYLEDYASLGLAALAVYELTFDTVWLDRARAMSDATVQWFWSDDTGAFYDTASDHEELIVRPREVADNATPSGTSLAVELLVRLAELLHDVEARRRATYVVETLAPMIARYPSAFGHILGAADMLINGAVEVAIVGDVGTADFRAMERAVAEQYVRRSCWPAVHRAPTIRSRSSRRETCAVATRRRTCVEATPATSPR